MMSLCIPVSSPDLIQDPGCISLPHAWYWKRSALGWFWVLGGAQGYMYSWQCGWYCKFDVGVGTCWFKLTNQIAKTWPRIAINSWVATVKLKPQKHHGNTTETPRKHIGNTNELTTNGINSVWNVPQARKLNFPGKEILANDIPGLLQSASSCSQSL